VRRKPASANRATPDRATATAAVSAAGESKLLTCQSCTALLCEMPGNGDLAMWRVYDWRVRFWGFVCVYVCCEWVWLCGG